MVEKAAVEEERGWEGGEGGRPAEGCSHIHHHLFVYIKTTDHLETDSASEITIPKSEHQSPFYRWGRLNLLRSGDYVILHSGPAEIAAAL